MIYELLYTSVPKGLKPGSKGYCTVLTTEGIPSALLERLESYCGYRHLFDPGSPDNPIAYGHRVLNLAGNTWHILSRVADAGFDYSGRSNLIGHFMAISQDELKGMSAGPTALMMSRGFFRKELVGEPRRVSEAETSKRLVGVMDRPQKAVTWNMVAGDAGWAGKLVQTTEESNESVSLVYALRTNTLKLLDEAVSILPKNKQWDITFNTFFTKSGEECRWRCYCANVPEAVPFKGSEFDLVDVKRKGLDPGDGVYVGAAREGKKMAGGVAKAGPALSNNAKLNTGKSVEAGKKLANIRKGKQEVEERKHDDARFLKEIDVKPRRVGSVPPPVLRDEHFDLLVEDLTHGPKTFYRNKSENPYKTALYISVPALLLIILALIFVGLRSQPNSKSDLVELEKSNSKKDSDTSTEIKPIDDTFEAKAKEEEKEAKKLAEAKAKEKEKEKEKEATKLAEAEAKEREKEEKAKTLAQKETQEKINKVVFVNAYKDDLNKGVVIVPLDTHLKRVLTSENNELILNKGITIVFPTEFNIKGSLDVNYIADHNRDKLAATKNKFKLSKVDNNKARINFSGKIPEVRDIEEICFAFSKLTLPNVSIIQYFEPLSLELISLTSPGDLSTTDALQFRVDKNVLKYKIFKELSFRTFELKPD